MLDTFYIKHKIELSGNLKAPIQVEPSRAKPIALNLRPQPFQGFVTSQIMNKTQKHKSISYALNGSVI